MSTPSLPQNDPNIHQRQKQLQRSQDKYQYKYDYDSLQGVPMAKGIPSGEEPSLKWTKKAVRAALKLAKNKLYNDLDPSNPSHHIDVLKIGKKIAKITLKLDLTPQNPLELLYELAEIFARLDSKRPEDINDYGAYYKSLDIPIISTNFQEDGIFARMQVAGQNPVMLCGLNMIPDDFPITDTIFQSITGFGGDTLASAAADGRLYFIDYVALNEINPNDSGSGQKYSYAPKAVFAIPLNHSEVKTALKPIAIQCGQNIDANNPLFNPNQGMAWEIAKTIVQIADFNYHELITHLGATHLLIEPFVVTTQRHLADNHPLKILLTPHFEGTIFINWSAQKSLVADGGVFDKLFSGTMASNRQLVGERLQQSFNDAMFPNDIKKRNVNNELLFYPYRDDGLKLWSAIHQWVSDYLSIYYKSAQDIQADLELKGWALELISKGGVKGFGDNDSGEITTLDYLIDAVTMIIFTASSQHAAVNFTQKDFAGYTPSMPAAGYTPAPENTNKVTQDWLDLLPPLNMASDQVDLTHLLAGVYYTKLGRYGRRYFKDQRISPFLNEFEATLEDIESDIQQRNREASQAGVQPYEYMLPSKTPQSINI